MLVVTSAAADPTLLTMAEISEAVRGAIDGVALQRLNARVSEILAGACCLERAGTATLTLREETYTETLRMRCPRDVIHLSRKPVTAVLSVVEGDTTLYEDDDYELADGRGLRRLQNDCPSWWASGKVIVSYRAGFATVPPALRELAAKLATVLQAERGRDPSLGSKEIPGVISETYRYGRPDDPLIPAEIMEGLIAGGFVLNGTMVA